MTHCVSIVKGSRRLPYTL